VDVNDERIITSGYAFTQVTGTLLPFPDTSFDVVISNHVIEHVGEPPEQLAHLRRSIDFSSPVGLSTWPRPAGSVSSNRTSTSPCLRGYRPAPPMHMCA
jgi:2-polyprenyl-3-methyl-5-hydroxy-6-metoxy-1,4-benzoquinol methylase